MSSRPRKKRRARKKQQSQAPWFMLIGACVALIGGALAFVAVQMSGQSYDEATLCEGETADHVTIVLLDLTDPLSRTQASRLKTMLDQEIDRSPTDTMMSIGVVSEDAEEWGSRFAKCKPPTGDQANALYQNPRQIADRYRSEFRQPLENTLSDMIRASEADSSPIMEALQALVADTPFFSTTSGSRQVIVISDMLQHSETLSAYRGQGWDYFQKTGASDRLAANLADVDVRIIQIPRQTNANTSLSEDFWVRYFDKQGSNLPEVSILGDL